jgi:hypothetical protein
MKFNHVYCKMFIYKAQTAALQITALTTGTHKTALFVLTVPHRALRLLLRIVARAAKFQGH